MKKMTIDKVAELAYVSRSVVSRVLNDHPNVSREARQRVMRVIEKYDYRPSSVARSLATDRTFEIGVLTPRRSGNALANSFWPLLHSGLFERCIERGYLVSLSMVSTRPGARVDRRILNDQRFDGYVLVTQEVTERVADAVAARDVPVALIGHDPERPAWPSVDVDNFAGAYAAVRHLLALGHTRIAAILGCLDMQESVDRRDGYRRALQEAGLSDEAPWTAVGDYSGASGFEIMQAWIERGLAPSAVFCASDTMAVGALSALHRAGIAVPQRLAVVGFDDLPLARYTVPPLTTVRQPIYEKGARAADLLLDQIEGTSAAEEHVTLEAELVVRQSCGANG